MGTSGIATRGPVVVGTGVPAAAGSGRRRGSRASVIAVDLLVLVLTTALVGFGGTRVGDPPWPVAEAARSGVSVAVLVAVALPLFGCWDARELGRGREEYVRVLRALAACAVVASLVALASKESNLRPWVFVALPLVGIALLGARDARRRWTRRARRRGRLTTRVLVVGDREVVPRLVDRARKVPEHGWRVVGACVPGGLSGQTVAGVAVVGGLADVGAAARTLVVDEVVVVPGTGWGGRELHHLAWELESTQAGLVLEPGLMEVTAPRLRFEILDGLPLLRLHHARFRGAAWAVKGLLDRALALVAIVVLLPLLIAIALGVMADGGPPFFRQERVGRDGARFRLVKFRSMSVDADGRRDALVAAGHDGAGPLFKLRTDPRITPIGRWLRRYSLDELPQLANVVLGSMSLVGPRPSLPDEIGDYDDDARRRLLVPPGMTGLWQVSGRSDLSWDESVRLDLRYVENWSPAMDLAILARTVGAVISGRGAY